MLQRAEIVHTKKRNVKTAEVKKKGNRFCGFLSVLRRVRLLPAEGEVPSPYFK
jgi:hypothetical protein